MSRMATNEYIGAKRRAYAQADRAKRKRILDEVCETTGFATLSPTPQSASANHAVWVRITNP